MGASKMLFTAQRFNMKARRANSSTVCSLELKGLLPLKSQLHSTFKPRS